MSINTSPLFVSAIPFLRLGDATRGASTGEEEQFMSVLHRTLPQYDGRSDDLRRLAELQLEVMDAVNSPAGCSVATAAPPLQKYAAAIQQLRERLLKQQQQGEEDSSAAALSHLSSSLGKEHSTVVFNLAALQSHEARMCIVKVGKMPTQASWKTAMQHLQWSACVVRHLRTQISGSGGNRAGDGQGHGRDDRPLLSPSFLEFWEYLLLADAQHAAYQCFASMPRTRQFVMAKQASAAANLYNHAGEVQQQQAFQLVDDLTDAARALSMFHSCKAEYHQSLACREQKKDDEGAQEAARLETALRFATLCQQFCEDGSCTSHNGGVDNNGTGWTGLLMSELESSTLEIQRSLSEVASAPALNESLAEIPPQQMVKVNYPKDVEKVLGQPQSILEQPLAITTAATITIVSPGSPPPASTVSSEESYPSSPPAGDGVSTATTTPPNSGGWSSRPHSRVVSNLKDDEKYVDEAGDFGPDYSSNNSGSIQTHHRLQARADDDQKVSPNDRNEHYRRYTEAFYEEMDRKCQQLATLAREKTETARQTLSTVNLPHALTAYRQQRSSALASASAQSGISPDLWERVQAVQKEAILDNIQREMWEIRDLADVAKTTYDSIDSLLGEDLQMDQLFREQHSDFTGHDVEQVQRSFKQALENYNRLMTAANDSDQLLIEKCQRMETDPKFRLLKFKKAQLDNLMPKQSSRQRQAAAAPPPEIDVSLLSKYLVDLSALFDERDMLLRSLESGIQSYDLSQDLARAGSNPDAAVDRARRSFDPLIADIHGGIDRQKELLVVILKANEAFMEAREELRTSAAASHQTESVADKIEDALEELEQFRKHLQEGRAFYDVVLPKLEKLRHQVGDVSARLTVERCEHEDRARRSRQEEEDARMAATLASSDGPGGNSGSGRHGDSISDIDNLGAVPSSASLGDDLSDDPLGESSASFGGFGGGGRGTGVSNEEREILGGIGGSSASHLAAQNRYQRNRVSPYPGVEQVSHDVPAVRVDDEKVASLVAMDFDPEKVVAALKKYDNDVERALNDLLSG